MSPKPTTARLLRSVVTVLALILVATGLSQLRRAEAQINERTTRVAGTPVTLFSSLDPGKAKPVILISHGFAGSQQLMRAYALSLARQGFVAVTFDYLGHGRHPEPLRGDVTKVEGATRALVEQTGTIADFALRQPGTDGRLALLGHSMASDVIVRYAQRDPRVEATVAVSMFSTAVTADAPRNLLVIVGGLEGFLKDEARRVLGLVTDTPVEAVTVGNFEDGSARRIAFADGVEHVGVLYSQEALREAATWLRAVFDAENPPPAPEIPGVGIPIVLLLTGLGLLAWPLAGLLPRLCCPPRGAALPWRRLLPAALVPALGTPVLLMAFPPDFMGVLVGGYLAVHFLVYGLISAAMLWYLARRPGATASASGAPEKALTPKASSTSGSPPRLLVLVGTTVLATAYLAGVFAWALDTTVTSYAITATRWPLVLATLVGTTAYFLTDEWMAHGRTTARGGHLFTRLCFLMSLGIAVALSFEDLFFLLIIAAVIVIYFLVYGLFSRWVYAATGHPAVGAVANAVSFAWALGAVFPFLGT